MPEEDPVGQKIALVKIVSKLGRVVGSGILGWQTMLR
jgi:hypothetical protein